MNTPTLLPAQIEQLKLWGTQWKKNGMFRIYFEVPEMLGLVCQHSQFGQMTSANYRGKEITLTQATQFIHNHFTSKFYFDVNSGKFFSQNTTVEETEYMTNRLLAALHKISHGY